MTDRIRTFCAGDWFGILGSRATVLLPPSERERVPDVWRVVDAGADFEEALDVVLAAGLRRLTDCVVTAREDEELRVLVRGRPTVSATSGGERIDLTGPADATWTERRLSARSALEVRLEEPAAGAPELSVGDGLIRVARLRQGGQATPEAPRLDTAPTTLDDRPGGGGDHDGATRSGVPTPAPATPLPGITGQVPAPGVVARAVARLLLSTGEQVDVDRSVVIGRAPALRRLTPPGRTTLVAVASPQHEISSTHLEIRPGSGADHGSAVVTDLGSTNGTVLVQPGLPREHLRSGIAVQLLPGAVLDLGDGLTIRVVSP